MYRWPGGGRYACGRSGEMCEMRSPEAMASGDCARYACDTADHPSIIRERGCTWEIESPTFPAKISRDLRTAGPPPGHWEKRAHACASRAISQVGGCSHTARKSDRRLAAAAELLLRTYYCGRADALQVALRHPLLCHAKQPTEACGPRCSLLQPT